MEARVAPTARLHPAVALSGSFPEGLIERIIQIWGAVATRRARLHYQGMKFRAERG